MGSETAKKTNRLAGRVAVVTGASRGLGKATALALAAEGAAVAVVARSKTVWKPELPGTIYSTVAEIEAGGGTAIAIAADLALPDDVERAFMEARAALGPIDLLVNNAALTVPGRPPKDGATPPPSAPEKPPVSQQASIPGMGPGSFISFPLKGYRRHLEIGLFASYRLMQLVLPDMLEARRGSIINISSLAAFIPGEGPYETSVQPTGFAYGGNKVALQHLTQSVAYEMAPYGIAVNALAPSEPVMTPGNLVAAAGEQDWASPDDFAEAVVRLALVDADKQTGQVLWSDDVLHPELGRRGWLRDI